MAGRVHGRCYMITNKGSRFKVQGLRLVAAVILLIFFSTNAFAGPEIHRGRDFDPGAPGPIGDRIPAAGRFGDGSNYFDIDGSGVATLHGTAKRGITMRPTIDVITQIALAKPAQIVLGVHKGFSMPVFDDDNEQLFAGGPIFSRWDEESDFIVGFVASLSGAEDVGDKFQFELLWDVSCCEGTSVATSISTTKEITVLEGRNGQYSNYCLEFTIDHTAADHIVPACGTLGMILRRIDASASEVNNNIIVWQYSDRIRLQIDKLYGEFDL